MNNFISAILLFGCIFIIIHNILGLILGVAYKAENEHHNDCRRTNNMHTWYRDDKEFLRCSICGKKALSD